jgi:chemotaxis protein MotB
MKRNISLIMRMAPAVLSMAFVGCVPYQQYEEVKNERDRLKTTNEDLVAKYNRMTQEVMRLKAIEAKFAAGQEKIAGLENLNKELYGKLQKVGNFKPDVVATGNLPKEIIQNPNTGELEVGDDVLFASGEATLKNARAKEVLDSLINLFTKDYAGQIIHISGHTDNDPLDKTRLRWQTNQRLGYERAYTVFKYFQEKGVDEKQVVIHSYSYLLPAADGTTKDAKAKNRRVSFGISPAVKV